MKGFVRDVLAQTSGPGVNFAEVRLVRRRTQRLVLQDGRMEFLSDEDEIGWGIRVLVNGAWGFACTSETNQASIGPTVAEAIAIARASRLVGDRQIILAAAPTVQDDREMAVKIDPFTVPLSDKVAALEAIDRALRHKQVVSTKATLMAWEEEKVYGNSEGSLIRQRFIETGAGMVADAVDGTRRARRSYPGPVSEDIVRMGYEHIHNLNLPAIAATVGEEAYQLLSAETCPSGPMDIILKGAHLSLQIHESAGHAMELDRALGHEAAYAGTSFLTPDLLKTGGYRYGSDCVNITADATMPGGRGSFFYDDEGVVAQRTPLVRDGIFVGYMSNRETAATTGTTSTGASLADGWNRIPIIRMTNVNLEPGTHSLEQIIAETKDGMMMDTSRTWSIDNRRLNFQFGTEIGYRIKQGKVVGLIKSPTYMGITPEFWWSCDAVADDKTWRIWGFPCGKGEPKQLAHTGHGVSAARIRNVQVGVVAQ